MEKGKLKPLRPSVELDLDEYKHTFKDPAKVLKLVTYAPLFPVLNGAPKKTRPLKDKDV